MSDENNNNGWGYSNIRERTFDIEYNAVVPVPTPCIKSVLLDTDVNYLRHFLASSVWSFLSSWIKECKGTQSSRAIIPNNQVVTGSVMHFYNIQSAQICNQFVGGGGVAVDGGGGGGGWG